MIDLPESISLQLDELRLKQEIASHELQCLLDDMPDNWQDEAEDLTWEINNWHQRRTYMLQTLSRLSKEGLW